MLRFGELHHRGTETQRKATAGKPRMSTKETRRTADAIYPQIAQMNADSDGIGNHKRNLRHLRIQTPPSCFFVCLRGFKAFLCAASVTLCLCGSTAVSAQVDHAANGYKLLGERKLEE